MGRLSSQGFCVAGFTVAVSRYGISGFRSFHRVAHRRAIWDSGHAFPTRIPRAGFQDEEIRRQVFGEQAFWTRKSREGFRGQGFLSGVGPFGVEVSVTGSPVAGCSRGTRF
jgi:hypothetical protein